MEETGKLTIKDAESAQDAVLDLICSIRISKTFKASNKT